MAWNNFAYYGEKKKDNTNFFKNLNLDRILHAIVSLRPYLTTIIVNYLFLLLSLLYYTLSPFTCPI